MDRIEYDQNIVEGAFKNVKPVQVFVIRTSLEDGRPARLVAKAGETTADPVFAMKFATYDAAEDAASEFRKQSRLRRFDVTELVENAKPLAADGTTPAPPCPTCKAPARGIIQKLYGVSLLKEGGTEFTGYTEPDWDSQEDVYTDKGQRTFQCSGDDAHEYAGEGGP